MSIEFKKNKQGKYQIYHNGELICDKEFENHLEAFWYWKANLQEAKSEDKVIKNG
jgi:hypothetical protein